MWPVHEIDGAVRQSDIARMLSISRSGISPPYCARRRGRTNLAVSSIRVPALGARWRMENWPLFGVGKEVLNEPRHKEKCRNTGQKKVGMKRAR